MLLIKCVIFLTSFICLYTRTIRVCNEPETSNDFELISEKCYYAYTNINDNNLVLKVPEGIGCPVEVYLERPNGERDYLSCEIQTDGTLKFENYYFYYGSSTIFACFSYDDNNSCNSSFSETINVVEPILNNRNYFYQDPEGTIDLKFIRKFCNSNDFLLKVSSENAIRLNCSYIDSNEERFTCPLNLNDLELTQTRFEIYIDTLSNYFNDFQIFQNITTITNVSIYEPHCIMMNNLNPFVIKIENSNIGTFGLKYIELEEVNNPLSKRYLKELEENEIWNKEGFKLEGSYYEGDFTFYIYLQPHTQLEIISLVYNGVDYNVYTFNPPYKLSNNEISITTTPSYTFIPYPERFAPQNQTFTLNSNNIETISNIVQLLSFENEYIYPISSINESSYTAEFNFEAISSLGNTPLIFKATCSDNPTFSFPTFETIYYKIDESFKYCQTKNSETYNDLIVYVKSVNSYKFTLIFQNSNETLTTSSYGNDLTLVIPLSNLQGGNYEAYLQKDEEEDKLVILGYSIPSYEIKQFKMIVPPSSGEPLIGFCYKHYYKEFNFTMSPLIDNYLSEMSFVNSIYNEMIATSTNCIIYKEEGIISCKELDLRGFDKGYYRLQYRGECGEIINTDIFFELKDNEYSIEPKIVDLFGKEVFDLSFRFEKPFAGDFQYRINNTQIDDEFEYQTLSNEIVLRFNKMAFTEEGEYEIIVNGNKPKNANSIIVLLNELNLLVESDFQFKKANTKANTKIYFNQNLYEKRIKSLQIKKPNNDTYIEIHNYLFLNDIQKNVSYLHIYDIIYDEIGIWNFIITDKTSTELTYTLTIIEPITTVTHQSIIYYPKQQTLNIQFNIPIPNTNIFNEISIINDNLNQIIKVPPILIPDSDSIEIPIYSDTLFSTGKYNISFSFKDNAIPPLNTSIIIIANENDLPSLPSEENIYNVNFPVQDYFIIKFNCNVFYYEYYNYIEVISSIQDESCLIKDLFDENGITLKVYCSDFRTNNETRLMTVNICGNYRGYVKVTFTDISCEPPYFEVTSPNNECVTCDTLTKGLRPFYYQKLCLAYCPKHLIPYQNICYDSFVDKLIFDQSEGVINYQGIEIFSFEIRAQTEEPFASTGLNLPIIRARLIKDNNVKLLDFDYQDSGILHRVYGKDPNSHGIYNIEYYYKNEDSKEISIGIAKQYKLIIQFPKFNGKENSMYKPLENNHFLIEGMLCNLQNPKLVPTFDNNNGEIPLNCIKSTYDISTYECKLLNFENSYNNEHSYGTYHLSFNEFTDYSYTSLTLSIHSQKVKFTPHIPLCYNYNVTDGVSLIEINVDKSFYDLSQITSIILYKDNINIYKLFKLENDIQSKEGFSINNELHQIILHLQIGNNEYQLAQIFISDNDVYTFEPRIALSKGNDYTNEIIETKGALYAGYSNQYLYITFNEELAIPDVVNITLISNTQDSEIVTTECETYIEGNSYVAKCIFDLTYINAGEYYISEYNKCGSTKHLNISNNELDLNDDFVYEYDISEKPAKIYLLYKQPLNLMDVELRLINNSNVGNDIVFNNDNIVYVDNGGISFTFPSLSSYEGIYTIQTNYQNSKSDIVYVSHSTKNFTFIYFVPKTIPLTERIEYNSSILNMKFCFTNTTETFFTIIQNIKLKSPSSIIYEPISFYKDLSETCIHTTNNKLLDKEGTWILEIIDKFKRSFTFDIQIFKLIEQPIFNPVFISDSLNIQRFEIEFPYEISDISSIKTIGPSPNENIFTIHHIDPSKPSNKYYLQLTNDYNSNKDTIVLDNIFIYDNSDNVIGEFNQKLIITKQSNLPNEFIPKHTQSYTSLPHCSITFMSKLYKEYDNLITIKSNIQDDECIILHINENANTLTFKCTSMSTKGEYDYTILLNQLEIGNINHQVHSSCQTEPTVYDPITNSCNTCININTNTPYYYDRNCYSSCEDTKDAHTTDEDNKLCIKNEESSIIKCASNEFLYKNTCISDCSLSSVGVDYLFKATINDNTTCVEICPKGTYGNKHNNICTSSCPYYSYNYFCYDTCSETIIAPYTYNNQCYPNCTINGNTLYIDNTTCTSSCPYVNYNTHCYDSCSHVQASLHITEPLYEHSTSHTCYTERECIINGNFIRSNLCVSSCESDFIGYDYHCIPECPNVYRKEQNGNRCYETCSDIVDSFHLDLVIDDKECRENCTVGKGVDVGSNVCRECLIMNEMLVNGTCISVDGGDMMNNLKNCSQCYNSDYCIKTDVGIYCHCVEGFVGITCEMREEDIKVEDYVMMFELVINSSNTTNVNAKLQESMSVLNELSRESNENKLNELLDSNRIDQLVEGALNCMKSDTVPCESFEYYAIIGTRLKYLRRCKEYSCNSYRNSKRMLTDERDELKDLIVEDIKAFVDHLEMQYINNIYNISSNASLVRLKEPVLSSQMWNSETYSQLQGYLRKYNISGVNVSECFSGHEDEIVYSLIEITLDDFEYLIDFDKSKHSSMLFIQAYNISDNNKRIKLDKCSHYSLYAPIDAQYVNYNNYTYWKTQGINIYKENDDIYTQPCNSEKGDFDMSESFRKETFSNRTIIAYYNYTSNDYIENANKQLCTLDMITNINAIRYQATFLCESELTSAFGIQLLPQDNIAYTTDINLIFKCLNHINKIHHNIAFLIYVSSFSFLLITLFISAIYESKKNINSFLSTIILQDEQSPPLPAYVTSKLSSSFETSSLNENKPKTTTTTSTSSFCNAFSSNFKQLYPFISFFYPSLTTPLYLKLTLFTFHFMTLCGVSGIILMCHTKYIDARALNANYGDEYVYPLKKEIVVVIGGIVSAMVASLLMRLILFVSFEKKGMVVDSMIKEVDEENRALTFKRFNKVFRKRRVAAMIVMIVVGVVLFGVMFVVCNYYRVTQVRWGYAIGWGVLMEYVVLIPVYIAIISGVKVRSCEETQHEYNMKELFLF